MIWIDVCALDDVIPNTGVCALLGDQQIAIIRLDTEVYALDNFDPASRAFVLSRGIVGDQNGSPKLASPIYKQRYDLRTGACLDDPALSVSSFPVRVRGGRIEAKVG